MFETIGFWELNFKPENGKWEVERVGRCYAKAQFIIWANLNFRAPAQISWGYLERTEVWAQNIFGEYSAI